MRVCMHMHGCLCVRAKARYAIHISHTYIYVHITYLYACVCVCARYIFGTAQCFRTSFGSCLETLRSVVPLFRVVRLSQWGHQHLPKAMRDELIALPKLVVGTAGGAAASGGGAAEEGGGGATKEGTVEAAEEGGGGAVEEGMEDAAEKRGGDAAKEVGGESDGGIDSDTDRLMGTVRIPSASPI